VGRGALAMTDYWSRKCTFAAVILAAGMFFPTVTVGQNINDFLRNFGGLVQQAMRQGAQIEWQKLPPGEYTCIDQALDQTNLGVNDLINRGVFPNDTRIAQVRSNCRSQAAQTPPSIGIQSSPYVVDGLALGGQVRPDSDAYKQYQCGPSDKFPGFVWCHKDVTKKDKQTEVTHSNSILHAQDGTAWYVNGYIEPAFFGPNDIENEIQRLSAKFGQPANRVLMPPRDGLPNAVIATWGKVELPPISASDMAIVASGGGVHGLLISFLGDLQRSAKSGVPVFRLMGGAGFAWAATFNQEGRGVLRYLTIDDSRIEPPIVATNTPPPSTSPSPVSPTVDTVPPTDVSSTTKGALPAPAPATAPVQKTAETETAKQAANESAKQAAKYKEQLEEQQKLQNIILIALAASIVLIVSVATILIVRLKRGTTVDDNAAATNKEMKEKAVAIKAAAAKAAEESAAAARKAGAEKLADERAAAEKALAEKAGTVNDELASYERDGEAASGSVPEGEKGITPKPKPDSKESGQGGASSHSGWEATWRPMKTPRGRWGLLAIAVATLMMFAGRDIIGYMLSPETPISCGSYSAADILKSILAREAVANEDYGHALAMRLGYFGATALASEWPKLGEDPNRLVAANDTSKITIVRGNALTFDKNEQTEMVQCSVPYTRDFHDVITKFNQWWSVQYDSTRTQTPTDVKMMQATPRTIDTGPGNFVAYYTVQPMANGNIYVTVQKRTDDQGNHIP
jgi:hypothetical protein